jgi:thiol-disulfide isomerase/thioredoxin
LKGKALLIKLLLPLIILIVSCNPQENKRGKTLITGTFTQFSGKKVELSRINIRSITPLDTAILSEKGEFRFRISIDSAGMYLLKINQKNYINLVLEQEKKVHVYSDKQAIRSHYRVEGSEGSQRLAEFEATLEKNKQKIDSLIIQHKQYHNNINPSSSLIEMDEFYEQVFQDQVLLSRKFIEENCRSLASLLVIERRFGMKKILTEERDGDYYLMLDTCLSARYPNNIHVLEHQKRLENILRQKAIKEHRDKLLSIGKKAPEIILEDPQGKSIPLHSLAGQKVIVYFWASWDKNSRKANKEMKRVYDMYAPGGLEVYAIALESYREPWQAAIQADDLDWINVTDYLNIQSATVSLFNVPKDLPFFYLLDEEMKIIFKGNEFVKLLELLKQ